MPADKGNPTSRRDLVKATGAGALVAALGTNVVTAGQANAQPAEARALFFDVGGTILDWSVMPEKIEGYLAERGVTVDGQAFWPAWRGKLFSYMMYNTMIGAGFIPLEELARRSTLAFAQSQDLELTSEDAAGILPLLGELDVYPDIAPGLEKMRQIGYQLVPHTQLSLPILKKALLDRFEWDWHFTSETFALYKPERDIYLKAIAAMGLDQSQVIYVTSNQFDVFASKGVGFRTAWVNRWNQTLEPYGYTPDWQVKDFVELADILESGKP